MEICEIWAVGQRRDAEVYAEAVQRVQEAVKIRPELVALVDVVERLGRLTRGIEVTSAAVSRDLVPDWLADRLIHTVGLPRERVAALDLKDAVDLWAAYMSGDQLKEP